MNSFLQYKNNTFIFFLLAIMFTAQSILSKEKSPQNQASLAIFHFLDETKTKNFAYLKQSLSDAISKEMKKIFYYERPNIQRNQKLADAFLQKSSSFHRKRLRRLCSTTEVDYAIFGSFTEIAEGKIEIESGIYSVSDDIIIASLTEEIYTDSSMFDNIEKLSVSLVASIKNYIKKQKQRDDSRRILILKEKSEQRQEITIQDNRSGDGRELGSALLSSAILPGWGQWNQGKRQRAYFFGGLHIGLGLATVMSYFYAKAKYNSYRDKKNSFESVDIFIWQSEHDSAFQEVENAHDSFVTSRNLFYIMGGLWLASYLINLADVYWTYKRNIKFWLTVLPEVSQPETSIAYASPLFYSGVRYVF